MHSESSYQSHSNPHHPPTYTAMDSTMCGTAIKPTNSSKNCNIPINIPNPNILALQKESISPKEEASLIKESYSTRLITKANASPTESAESTK